MYIYIIMCIYIYKHIYIYIVYVCVYIYIYRERVMYRHKGGRGPEVGADARPGPGRTSERPTFNRIIV